MVGLFIDSGARAKAERRPQYNAFTALLYRGDRERRDSRRHPHCGQREGDGRGGRPLVSAQLPTGPTVATSLVDKLGATISIPTVNNITAPTARKKPLSSPIA